MGWPVKRINKKETLIQQERGFPEAGDKQTMKHYEFCMSFQINISEKERKSNCIAIYCLDWIIVERIREATTKIQ